MTWMCEAENYDTSRYDSFGVNADGIELSHTSRRTDGIIATSIGRNWPYGGFVGALYIELEWYLKNRHLIEIGATWPPKAAKGEPDDDSRKYSAHYINVRYSASVRYVGFFGTFVKRAEGGDITLNLWHPVDTKFVEVVLKPSEIDGNAAVCLAEIKRTFHYDLPAAVTHNSMHRDGDPICVFIQDTAAAKKVKEGLSSPKLPFWLGER